MLVSGNIFDFFMLTTLGSPNAERDKDPKYVANVWSSSAMPRGKVWWFDKRSANGRIKKSDIMRNRRSEFRSSTSVKLNHPLT